MKNLQIPFYLKLIHFYTRFFPIDKGKGRLLSLFLRKSNDLPRNIIVFSKNGRKFRADLNDGMYKALFFMGYYEKHETEMLKRLVHEGDTVFDIGANFGWYTTLFAKLVGEKGEVHAFEPVPKIFNELKYNVKLNNVKDNVFLNNLALGAEKGKAFINVFRKLPHGHASMSTLGRKDYETFECDVLTLDQYISDNAISKVDLIKCDVEGAEMMVLKGGSKLFMHKPPVVLIELKVDTANQFGYNPEDLLLQLLKYNRYTFFKIINRRKLKKLECFTKYKHDNILCLPDNQKNLRMELFKKIRC